MPNLANFTVQKSATYWIQYSSRACFVNSSELNSLLPFAYYFLQHEVDIPHRHKYEKLKIKHLNLRYALAFKLITQRCKSHKLKIWQ